MSDESCPGDEQLLELLSSENAGSLAIGHVAQCQACQRRLDALRRELEMLKSAAASDSDIPPTDVRLPTDAEVRTHARQSTPRIPAIIGPYRIVGVLGKGGQGFVLRGVHSELQHDVAIKISGRTVTSKDDTDRLRNEGKLLVSLNHPNLARALDFGFYDDRPYLVMEYVRGRTLEQFAEQARPDKWMIARLLAEACHGLHAAHRQGIVHDDVKPSNMIVDDREHLKLIDFGLARLTDLWNPQAELTGGTAEYMSPEAAKAFLRGPPDDKPMIADPRSDVFCLGAVLYRLLTGKAPFAAHSPGEALSLAERGDFNRTALVGKEVPAELREICLRCMKIDPNERYRSAAELASAFEKVAKPPRDVKKAAGLIAAVLAVVVLGWAIVRRPVNGEADPPRKQSIVEHVTHSGQERQIRNPEDICKYLPLQPSDRISLRCDVPAEFQAAMFQIDSTGIRELAPLNVDVNDAVKTVRFPQTGTYPVAVEDDATLNGSCLFLVCASQEKPTIEDVKAALASDGAIDWQEEGWSTPITVLISRDGVDVLSMGEVRGDDEAPFVKAKQSTLEIKKAVREKFKYVWGVVIPWEQQLRQ